MTTLDIWTHNDHADFYRGNGFNVIPVNGKVPVEQYKQFFDKPIPIELHNYWKKTGLFDNGIAIINGRLWHHEYRKNMFAYTVDCDSEEGTKLICTVNGVQLTPEEMTKKGIAAEKTSRGYHFIGFSDVEFPNLAANVSGIEVKGSHLLTTVTPTGGREFIGDSMKAFEQCVNHSEFMYHINDRLKTIGIEYVNGNTKADNPVLKNEQKIPNGQRHPRLLSYANSLISRLYKTTNRDTIYKYFETYKDTECAEPESFPQSELIQIFNDAWNERVVNIAGPTSSALENPTSDKVLSVLEAKRLQGGKPTVIGTIVSVSDMYKLEQQNDTKATIEYRNAKSIQLEDTEKLDENERLDVVLYDKMIDNVVAGETVKIVGNMRIEDKKANGKSKKKYNVLHAESIEYLNRKEILVTDKDIESFEKFISYPQLLERVVSMFAPNIIGHYDVKRGLLRAVVGGVNRGKKGGGRIDTLEVGDPGTAKSKLGIEVAELKPNSRHVSAPHATTKTITAIVEKINDSVSLSLGSIPLSKGAICAIDEINTFSMEDQSRLLDVLEEGRINLDKMGRRYTIPAPTTVIATANPISGKWNSNQVATKEEIELKRSLIDRFTQIYTFRDDMDENQTNDFVTDMSDIRKRVSHNYEFLKKYLIHASGIKDVKFTKNAEDRLNQFWVQAKLKGFMSIRMYNGLYKIAEAQAKLQLRNIVDDEIVDQVIEDVQLMMIQYGETVGQFIGPHELAVNRFVEILRDNHPTSMSLESICELAIQKDEKIGFYLGYIWTLRDNWKLRNVFDSLLNNRNVIRIQEKPVVLQFLCDGCDLCVSKSEKNIEENIKHITSDILETGNNFNESATHTSHTSHEDGDDIK